MASQFLPSTIAELKDTLGLIPHPEGGFFLETFRAGAQPMASRGQTDFSVASRALVTTECTSRPDNDTRRNALTCIFWTPTLKSPTQPLVQNQSDHVHLYQGGLPFVFHMYDPVTGTFTTATLGPDISNGHVLQLPVAAGLWKSGHLLTEYPGIQADYSLIAEAVGPGFDFHDFRFVEQSELDTVNDLNIREKMFKYIHGSMNMDEIGQHYTDETMQEAKAKTRL